MASDGITPISMINFLYQNASFVASNAAMYSASMVESVITVCLKLFQLTTPPLYKNTSTAAVMQPSTAPMAR